MVLRETTSVISVKYVPRSEQTKENDIKPNTIKSCTQNRNISQNNEMFLNVFAAKGFKILKYLMNCYVY